MFSGRSSSTRLGYRVELINVSCLLVSMLLTLLLLLVIQWEEIEFEVINLLLTLLFLIIQWGVIEFRVINEDIMLMGGR